MLVFINKLDREGKDAFDLLDEVEQKLGLRVTPMSFPIGMGYDFKGIYNIYDKRLNIFSGDNKQNISAGIEFNDLKNPELDKVVGDEAAETLRPMVASGVVIDARCATKFRHHDYHSLFKHPTLRQVLQKRA